MRTGSTWGNTTAIKHFLTATYTNWKKQNSPLGLSASQGRNSDIYLQVSFCATESFYRQRTWAPDGQVFQLITFPQHWSESIYRHSVHCLWVTSISLVFPLSLRKQARTMPCDTLNNSTILVCELCEKNGCYDHNQNGSSLVEIVPKICCHTRLTLLWIIYFTNLKHFRSKLNLFFVFWINRFPDGAVRLRNPNIELMDQDILYHLALGSGSVRPLTTLHWKIRFECI
jgi:hypothetical protein